MKNNLFSVKNVEINANSHYFENVRLDMFFWNYNMEVTLGHLRITFVLVGHRNVATTRQLLVPDLPAAKLTA